MKTKADILIVGNLLCINEIRGGADLSLSSSAVRRKL